MMSSRTHGNNRNGFDVAVNGGRDQERIEKPARRERSSATPWTGWFELWVSAGTAFIIAGGSALLGASTINAPTPTTIWVALVSGAIATANDIRQQLKRPPVEARRA